MTDSFGIFFMGKAWCHTARRLFEAVRLSVTYLSRVLGTASTACRAHYEE